MDINYNKMIKKVLLVGAIAVLFASCGNQGGKEEAVAVAFADFETAAVDLVDKNVSIEGTVVHVCSHGGKRMFISDEEGEKRIKIEVSDETTAFTPDMEGSIVKVTGKVVEFRIDEPYLAEWEAELKAEMAEGDTTVEHETDPTFDVEHIHNDSKYEDLERIANYRNEIAENGKGFIAFYSLTYISHEVIEAAAPKMDEATEEHDHNDHAHAEEAQPAAQPEAGGLTKTEGDRTKATIQGTTPTTIEEKAASMNKALDADDRTKSTIESGKVNVEEAKADLNKATAPAVKDVRTIKKADGTK
jgi:hypothetical protein